MRGGFNIIAGLWRVPYLRRGLILTLLAGFCLFALRTEALLPARANLTNLRNQAINLQVRLDNLDARRAMHGDYQRLTGERDALITRLSAPVGRSDLVERLAELSANSGTRVIHGANSFGKPTAGIIPVLQDLTVEGAYEQLRAFLGELARIETLTLIRSAEFSANGEGTLVRVKLRLITYNGDRP